MADEFSLIDTYFAPLSNQIGDDCAILDLPAGQRLATSVDTMVEGVHFPVGAPPQQMAYRAVAAALSDLAAVGAQPLAITLALTLSDSDPDWLAQFASGIADSLREFQVELIGGDTTSGPLTVSVQVFGALPADQALLRSGARPGDAVYISGNPGDAAAALAVIGGTWGGDYSYQDYLLARFYRPTPRLQLGRLLLEFASSAIDVSDGLLADAGHLCEQSGVAISLDEQALPLSSALQSLADDHQARTWALSGGDDYELLFTVAPENVTRVPADCTRIGTVSAGCGVTCGHPTQRSGYQHFSAGPAVSAGSAFSAGSTPDSQPAPRTPHAFSSWIQFLAFGFGSGHAPKAPGTAGTLLAIPLYLLFCDLSLPMYTLLLVVSAALGIWLCGRASRELGVHDHPGIVWDEFVGYWITMWALPSSWLWVVAGFLVFRLFDILKPWPISVCDKRVHGGVGIMLDDIVAGLISCGVLHACYWLVNVYSSG